MLLCRDYYAGVTAVIPTVIFLTLIAIFLALIAIFLALIAIFLTLIAIPLTPVAISLTEICFDGKSEFACGIGDSWKLSSQPGFRIRNRRIFQSTGHSLKPGR